MAAKRKTLDELHADIQRAKDRGELGLREAGLYAARAIQDYLAALDARFGPEPSRATRGR